jgi:predicted MFS family arabinose efflux permease
MEPVVENKERTQVNQVTQAAKVAVPSLWRNRDFMLLWSGQTVSLIGTGITQTAFPLLVWDITHSAAQVGLVGAMGTIPYVVLSLLAGALIDRWNRKLVMILCDTGRALNLISLLAVLTFGHLVVIQLYINALVEGTFFVFFNLAEVSCLPRVVTKEQLSAATAQNQATDGLTTLMGPLLGGALYSLRQALPFLADATSYVVSVVSLLFIRVEFQEERSAVRHNLFVEIKEGLLWLWGQPLIRYIAFLTGGLNFITAGLVPILVVLVKQQHGSSFIFGAILTIGGIGGIGGALIGGAIQRRFRFGQVIISVVWLQTLLWPLIAIVHSPILLGVILAAIFITSPVYNVVQFSYRLSLIPDELQGRVNSVFRLLAFGFQPLGWALTGLLIQTVNVIPTILLLFGAYLLLAILTTANPHVRHARPIVNEKAGA